MNPAEKIRGLYVIVDNSARPDRTHLEIAEAALAGGAGILQLRAKTLDKRHIYETALKLRGLTRDRGAVLIINDHVDIAEAVGADGVHLGQEDLPIQAARKVAGKDFPVGVSTHSIEQAVAAEAAGADYIGFGAVYATASKERPTEPQGPERLRRIVEAVSIPVVAIGGIKKENVPEIARAGAAGFAVISAVSAAGDMKKEVRELISIWEKESPG